MRTRLNDISKLLPHCQKQQLLPRLLALALGHAKRPGAAPHVPRILPDRLHAALEEMYAILHLQRVERKAVVGFPERLQRDDVFEEHGLSVLVRGVVAVLVVVEGPCVLEGVGAHAPEHVHFCGVALGGDG